VRIQQCEFCWASFHKRKPTRLSTGWRVVSGGISERVLPSRWNGGDDVPDAPSRRGDRARSDWKLPLAYLRFWTVKLGGWMPPSIVAPSCGKHSASGPPFQSERFEGLHSRTAATGDAAILARGRDLFFSCLGKIRRPAGREFDAPCAETPLRSLEFYREASLHWIEF